MAIKRSVRGGLSFFAFARYCARHMNISIRKLNTYG